jgi:hypothetical protein
MKAYGGVEVQLHHSSPRQQMEVSAQLHTPAALLLGKWPRTKDGVGPRDSLDAMDRKNLTAAGNRTPAVQPIARR